MGQFVPGRVRRLAFELDLEWGAERAGMPLEVQVLTSGDDVPEVVHIEQIRVPAPTDRRTDGRSASPLLSTRPRPPGPYCVSRIQPVRATHRDPTDTPATTSRSPTRARSLSLALARAVPPARAGVDTVGRWGSAARRPTRPDHEELQPDGGAALGVCVQAAPPGPSWPSVHGRGACRAVGIGGGLCSAACSGDLRDAGAVGASVEGRVDVVPRCFSQAGRWPTGATGPGRAPGATYVSQHDRKV